MSPGPGGGPAVPTAPEDEVGGHVRNVFRRLGAVVVVVGGIATTVVGVAAGPAGAGCDAPRLISVTGFRAAEGTSVGQREFTRFEFAVSTSAASCPQGGTARYETVAYTAGRADFVGQAGELSFKADDTGSQTVTVLVVQDAEPEPNECFSVRLSKPGGRVEIGTAEAAGIILDDDRGQRKPSLPHSFICSE
jgi:hypothetical protein